MIALLRYLTADTVRGQRWLAPLLVYLVAMTALDAGGGTLLPDYASTAALLLPVGLWLAVVASNSEDPIQTAITVVTVGSGLRVRLAKLAVGYLGCLLLTVVALGWPLLSNDDVTARTVGVGLLAHLLTGLAGVGLGALASRPVVVHTAWAVLVGVAVSLAELVVPHAPPAHALLSLLQDGHRLRSGLVLVTVQTAALVLVAVGVAQLLARRRT